MTVISVTIIKDLIGSCFVLSSLAACWRCACSTSKEERKLQTKICTRHFFSNFVPIFLCYFWLAKEAFKNLSCRKNDCENLQCWLIYCWIVKKIAKLRKLFLWCDINGCCRCDSKPKGKNEKYCILHNQVNGNVDCVEWNWEVWRMFVFF